MIGLTSLSKKVDKLDADLRSLTAKRDQPFVSPAVLKDALDKIEAKVISARAKFDDLAEDRKALMPEVEEKLEALRKKIMEVLSNISSNTSGGGNANRNIQIASVNVLRPFTDINFIAGSNVTITTSPNQTTKYTDITIASTGAAGSDITIGTTTITGGTDTRILYNNAGVVGEYTLTGTGTVVVMATSPTLTTPVIGAATGTSLTVSGLLASATGLTLEETGAGTDKITLQAPASIAAPYTLTLPVDDGDAGEVLSTDGDGVLSWEPAPSATTITVADEATDTSCFPVFVTAATGALGPKSNAGLTFNSNTSVLTATAFVGPLTGNVTGNVSGTAATVTTAAQPAITSLGTLTTLTVDDITINGNTISSAGASSLAITPTAGQAILLDGTISIDAGVVTGITSLGVTGTRVTAGFFTDLTVTNAIAGSITGTAAVGTAVTVADETTDTSCFINFTTAATGNLGIKSNTNMTFNSNTGVATFASTVLTTTDINGGTVDGTIIGGASAAAATITTLIITSFGGNWTNAGRTVADLGIVTTVDINGGTVDGVTIGGASAGAITGTTITANTGFMPDANDGAYLGQAGTAFSDLFLAEGGVINWDSSDVTLTQTGNVLAVAGGDLRVATADVGTNADSVPTLSSTNTLTNKTLTAPVINAATLSGTITLAESTSIALDPAQGDATWTGITRAGTAGATLAFGDLCYLAAADSRWELTDADSATTADRMLGMCVLAAAADGDPTVMLLMGNIQAASKFPSMTIGSAVYVGESAGAVQVAIPTGADNVIRRVGFALTADELYFNPSMDSQTTVA